MFYKYNNCYTSYTSEVINERPTSPFTKIPSSYSDAQKLLRFPYPKDINGSSWNLAGFIEKIYRYIK